MIGRENKEGGTDDPTVFCLDANHTLSSPKSASWFVGTDLGPWKTSFAAGAYTSTVRFGVADRLI